MIIDKNQHQALLEDAVIGIVASLGSISTAGSIPHQCDNLKPTHGDEYSINFKCDQDGTFKASLIKMKMSSSEVLNQREERYQLFVKLNIDKDKSQVNGSTPVVISDYQLHLLREYAMTDYGSEMILKVIKDDIAAINKGFFDFTNEDNKCEKRTLADNLDGKLSFDGATSDEYTAFKVNSSAGYGASAQLALVSLGHKGFKRHLPVGGPKVDPLAILHHEFCHTKFGIPHDASQLEGEAKVVRECENPVRVKNGYTKRRLYYDPEHKKTIDVSTGEVRAGKWRWDNAENRMVPHRKNLTLIGPR